MANTQKVREFKNIDPKTLPDYRNLSEKIEDDGKSTSYYAFDLIEGQKQTKPNGKVWERDFILCPASAEVLSFQKISDKWYLLLGLQSRSVVRVNVDGEIRSQLFLEQFAGCLDKDESFVDAAKREALEESGGKVKYLSPLIENTVTRHVGRAPEPSRFFWAILEEQMEEQSLDETEIILVKRFALTEVRKEFLAYITGEKNFFFGYELPVETLSAISTFFFLENSGIINLDKPDPEKNLLD